MSTSISLTYPIAYNPGVVRSDSPGLLTASEIFRRAAAITRTHAFQITMETIALLSIFTSLTIWAFAVSPSLSSL